MAPEAKHEGSKPSALATHYARAVIYCRQSQENTMEWATVTAGDKIEIKDDGVWVPAVIRRIFPDRELGFFTAELDHARMVQVMINKRKISWRHPDAAISA